jgi:Zn-dependent protease
MHWTFLIIIGWVVLSYAAEGVGVLGVVAGVALVLAVFGCVVLHELGHALTARRFGIRTRDITLLPIGGVARLERMPDDPKQELLVAAAGPAVNVVIAGVLFVVLDLAGALTPIGRATRVGGSLLGQLMWVNVFLVGFNLLPAFPMDGGRILRALLATRMNYVKSTRIAAGVGQAMAILFGFWGLVGPNPFLVFIAIFVYLGAQAEAQQTEMRSALAGALVRDAMMTRFQVLELTDSIGRAVEELLAGAQHDFPVTSGGRVVGLLIRADLVRAAKDRGRETPIAEVMRRDLVVAGEGEGLDWVLAQMRARGCSTAPVVRDGTLVGLLTLENVGELVMVNSALEEMRDRVSHRAER